MLTSYASQPRQTRPAPPRPALPWATQDTDRPLARTSYGSGPIGVLAPSYAPTDPIGAGAYRAPRGAGVVAWIAASSIAAVIALACLAASYAGSMAAVLAGGV